MIGALAKKNKEYTNFGIWKSKDLKSCKMFRFEIQANLNVYNETNNNLRGTSGTLTIKTMARIDFKPEDKVYINRGEFVIENIEEDDEVSNSNFLAKSATGRVAILSLRKNGI